MYKKHPLGVLMRNHGASYTMNYIKLTILILVFLFSSHYVHADTLYYQPVDDTIFGNTNPVRDVIGSFTTSGFTATSLTKMVWEWKNDTGFPACPMYLTVATSTAAFGTVYNLSTSNETNSSGEYELEEEYVASGVGVSFPAGTYNIYAHYNCGAIANNTYKIKTNSFDDIYGFIVTNDENLDINASRIKAVIPEHNATISTTTPELISASIYINPIDFNGETGWGDITNLKLRQTITLVNAPVLGNIWGGTGDWVAQQSNTIVYEYDIDSSGHSVYSTTTTFSQEGQRQLKTEILIGQSSVFDLIFGENIFLASTTYFTVGGYTTGDAITQSISDSFNELSGVASTTVDNLSIACNPFSGNFDIVICFYRLIVPDSQTATALFQETYDMVFSRAPLGYFTDFISIMSTSTVGTLTLIDATIPTGMVGSGKQITLDITNVFDFVLDSTTTPLFNSANASSTETFFVQTNRYWTIIVSILFVLYLMRRLLGSHIIPHADTFKVNEYPYNKK